MNEVRTLAEPRRRPHLAHLAIVTSMVASLWATASWADAITDYNLAVQFYKQRQFDRAAVACADFIKNYPQHELARNGRLYWGQALVQLKKFQEAREQFREFLKFPGEHPDRALAVYRVAECSYFLADYDSARDELAVYLKGNPGHTLAEWAWVYLADSHARLKANPQAIQVYEGYLEKYPQGQLREEAQFGLAKVFEAQGNREKSQTLFLELSKNLAGPRAADALFQLAASYFDGADYSKSAAAFELLRERYPLHRHAGLAALNAGFARFHLQEFSVAITHFEAAAQLPDFKPTAEYWRGLSCKSLGDFPRAISILSAAYNAAPQDALAENIQFQWADCELRSGNYQRARELFLQVQKQWPQGEFADDALYSAADAAYLARDFSAANELSAQFANQYADSSLKNVADILRSRILMAQGDALISAGQDLPAGQELFKQSEKLLTRIVAESTLPSTVALARLQLARTYERLGDYDRALDAAKKLLESETGATAENRLDARLIRSNACLQLKRFEEAGKEFAELLQGAVEDSAPAAPMVLSGLAVARAESGQWAEVGELMMRLRAVDTTDKRFSAAACRIGDLAYANKKFDLACELFEKVVSDFPQGEYYLVALSGLAHAKYDIQDYPAAGLAFATLAEQAKSDPVLRSHALHVQGLSLKQAGQVEAALKVFEAAAREFAIGQDASAPPTPAQLQAAHNAYQCARAGAVTAGELQRLDLANQLFELAWQGLRQQPKEKQTQLDALLFAWANLNYSQEKYQKSDELFRLLLQEQPEGELADMARVALGESAYQEKRYDAAKELFTQLADNPATTSVLQERALTQLVDIGWHTQQWPDVVKWATQLAQGFPDSSRADYANFRAGEANLHLEQISLACTLLEQVRQKLVQAGAAKPVWWPEVWILLAGARFKEKNHAELDKVAEELRTLSAGTDAAGLLYKMDLLQGRSYVSRAEFDSARAAFSRVLAAEPARGTAAAAEAQFRIAETHLTQKNYELAHKEYYKVVVMGFEIPEFQAPSLLQAGRCDMQLKRWNDARLTFEDLIRKFPNSKEAAEGQRDLESLKPFLTAQ